MSFYLLVKKCTYGKRFKGRIIGCCEMVFSCRAILILETTKLPQQKFIKTVHGKLVTIKLCFHENLHSSKKKKSLLSYRDKQIG